ncbi:MAG: hypothetical protein QOK34_371 [Gaiellaceae bacterium]|nr:hypothetical protein [Gaiellaceae bacterium]
MTCMDRHELHFVLRTCGVRNREDHADEEVEPAAPQLLSGLVVGLVSQRDGLVAAFGFVAQLFEAMGALPAEQNR